MIVERLRLDLVGVVRRLRRTPDPASQFSLRLAREIRLRISEVLGNRPKLLRHDPIVVRLPAGVATERFGLDDGLRRFGSLQSCRTHSGNQDGIKTDDCKARHGLISLIAKKLKSC